VKTVRVDAAPTYRKHIARFVQTAQKVILSGRFVYNKLLLSYAIIHKKMCCQVETLHSAKFQSVHFDFNAVIFAIV